MLLRRPPRPARATTAVDALRTLVRAHLGPALRAEGLRGSGSAWSLPCDTHWVLVGVERAVEPDESALRFAPRLAVVGRAAWTAARAHRPLPEVPPATAMTGVGWERRLPELVPGVPDDAAWALAAGDDVAPVAAGVLAPLRRHGLPALRAELARARAARPRCAATACARPAELALRAPRQRLFLCARHARSGPAWEVLGRWPDLLAG